MTPSHALPTITVFLAAAQFTSIQGVGITEDDARDAARLMYDARLAAMETEAKTDLDRQDAADMLAGKEQFLADLVFVRMDVPTNIGPNQLREALGLQVLDEQMERLAAILPTADAPWKPRVIVAPRIVAPEPAPPTPEEQAAQGRRDARADRVGDAITGLLKLLKLDDDDDFDAAMAPFERERLMRIESGADARASAGVA